jgi:hypothetical protein
MRRILAASIVVLAGGGALVGGAAASAIHTPARARLRGFVCQHALEPSQRLVSVVAVMRPLPGTRRLELRFDLIATGPAATMSGYVHGGDLGTWISPPKQPITLGTRPGDVWSLNHPVADLPAPATYRFRVTFRWVGAHRRVLGDAVRESPRCIQPELRPDLQAVAFVAQPMPNKPKRDSYVATITDDGSTGAGPFDVEFTDGTIIKHHVVSHIKPHQTLTLNFEGPVCDSTAPPTMTIDPTQQVDDYNRTNNSLTATCAVTTPASGTGSVSRASLHSEVQ